MQYCEHAGVSVSVGVGVGPGVGLDIVFDVVGRAGPLPQLGRYCLHVGVDVTLGG